MHPAIMERICTELERSRKGLVIVDAALLFTVGLDREMDVAILVTAPERLKVKRLIETGLAREEAVRRLKLQEPDAKVWRRADFVLENKGSLAELKRKSRALWNFFYSNRLQHVIPENGCDRTSTRNTRTSAEPDLSSVPKSSGRSKGGKRAASAAKTKTAPRVARPAR